VYFEVIPEFNPVFSVVVDQQTKYAISVSYHDLVVDVIFAQHIDFPESVFDDFVLLETDLLLEFAVSLHMYFDCLVEADWNSFGFVDVLDALDVCGVGLLHDGDALGFVEQKLLLDFVVGLLLLVGLQLLHPDAAVPAAANYFVSLNVEFHVFYFRRRAVDRKHQSFGDQHIFLIQPYCNFFVERTSSQKSAFRTET